MKEQAVAAAIRGGGGNHGRSAVERERTKMRERQRRSITTNIFHGLRKHGGYRLTPRADINEVLRHLAGEAGWIVEPDGTTYRSPNSTLSNGGNACPMCGGGGRKSASCSYLGGGGECSTTTSPRRAGIGESAVNNLSSGGLPVTNDALLAIYMSASDGGYSAAYGGGRQLHLLREAGLSNQDTPAGSP